MNEFLSNLHPAVDENFLISSLDINFSPVEDGSLNTISTLKAENTCGECEKVFSTSSNLNQHFKIHQNEKLFKCNECGKTFGRKSNLNRHRIIHESVENIKLKCDKCEQVFSRHDNLKHHLKLHQNSSFSSNDCEKVFSTSSNLNQYIKIHQNEKLFKCGECQKTFGRRSNLNRHRIIHEIDESLKFKCSECEQVFSRRDNLKHHLKLHQNLSFSCNDCEKVFQRKVELRQHIRTQHPRVKHISVKRKPCVSHEKFKRGSKKRDALNVFKTLMFYSDESNGSDLKVFQMHTQTLLEENLRSEVQEKSAIKWYMIIRIMLERKTSDGEVEVIQPFFRCPCFIELVEDNINHHLEEGFSKINKSFEEFIQGGSQWLLKKILYLELKIAKYHPLAASSFIATPQKLFDKRAILNIQNFDDNKCLVWCLLAHRMKIERENNPQRLSHYIPYENDIQLGKVQCPVPLQKIPIIEALNNFRINVFGYEEDEVCPLYVSPRKDEEVINLLLIGDDEKLHYCLIRNFSRLLGDRTKHDGVYFYCYRCLHGFQREDSLKEHIRYCEDHTAQVIKMPDAEDNILKFSGVHLQHPVGYVIYADFESLLIPIASTSPSSEGSFTEKTAYHYPCGYAYVIVGPDGHSIKPIQVYRGRNVVEHFLEQIMCEQEIIKQKLLDIKPMKLSREEEKSFQEDEVCSICQKYLGTQRVRDHDHLTGAYRGAAHTECNLNFKQPMKIPVIFHNLKNYDGHHIMSKLGKFKDYEIDVIASSMENYIMFKLRKPKYPVQLVFLDSFQFLPTSLEKLVQNLEASQFFILKENFSSSANLNLLRRKGVYPYDYFSSFEKFKETQLPPPSSFFNSLTHEDISDEDYQHAQSVWKTFNLKTLGEYHDLYVKTDVLLLADVFQNFRKLCLQYYNIDCAHLFTAPSLAWQACLKMSETPLELLTDLNMLLMIENGIRGGISMISHRYAKANIPNSSEFNEKEPASCIMYWDANNLYGWAMSQYLPFGGFEWVDSTQISENFILDLSDESSIGYIMEVDLEYPRELHDLHNEYPVAPERVTVSEGMLSPYAKSLLTGNFIGTPKLIPNLQDKENYVLHYRNLKFYLKLGLKLKKIHKVLKFNQAPWLQKYINFNTEKRKEATSSFEKDFFKLLNNSVYGKTMENLRKRRNIVLCNNEKRAKKLVASPTFKSFKTFNEDLTAVERLKTSILMNRPIYVGFAILELSKLLMFDFHYNFVKRKYQDQARLLFTDTDSLCYHIQTHDIFSDMKQDAHLFDFSDYPKDHSLFSTTNKKIIGKFKDELNGELAIEFVGLKSKMYSIKSVETEKKRAKGVSTQIVRQKMKHKDYFECLQQQKTSLEKQRRIAQDSHSLFTLTQNKISLSPFDDKRFLLDDGISSFAYGHYCLQNEE